MKKRFLWVVFFFAVALGLLFPAAAYVGAAAQAAAQRVLLLTAKGAVSAPMADYLERGIRYAEQHDAGALIFQLDTPGGDVSITNAMVQKMRASSVPVVVYVAPRGAMAGSAGTLLTLAGHLAAMAPETAIGAASPVGAQGEDISQTMQRKTKEILKASVRSIASERSPEAIALAEQPIEEARAVSAREALQVGLVDVLADDVSDLLRQMEGKTVQVNGKALTLHTAEAPVQDFPSTFIEQLLMTLTNPNIVFLLLAIGVQAILIELSSPGGWVAGFIGVVCLMLAIYGLGVLPVNWFGILFILMSFVLFFLELKMPTHGALTTAGVFSFIVGALVLFNSADTPNFQRVSVPLVIIVALLTAGTFAFGVGFALRAQRLPIRSGMEALVGQRGTVRVALARRGQVQVASELWSAEPAEGHAPIPEGTTVEVVSSDGIRLRVRALPEE